MRRYGALAKVYYRDHRAALFSLHPHFVLSAVSTFGLLQQLLPDEFVDDRAWTDIFSDRQLYRTREVGALPARLRQSGVSR